MATQRKQSFWAAVWLPCILLGGLACAPVHADPAAPDKGKQGKGKGGDGTTIPIKVEPPIITKDPKSPPPPPPKKKDG